MSSKPAIYGIRHHGPGCARSLIQTLEAARPEVLLLESPPEMESLLVEASHEAMKPPLAVLIYQVDKPEIASFYPFARFSPEWQVILWASKEGIPIRCMDLPATHTFACREQDLAQTEQTSKVADEETLAGQLDNSSDIEEPDPFSWFAKADGYTDGERWWNDRVEERSDSKDFFDAILEAVTALRHELAKSESKQTLRREAWMRKTIREAQKDGYNDIAVVCGAWHAPVLDKMPKVKDDHVLLKGLPKVKVAATWTPWTLDRLTMNSGYGAGILSPGWYDHIWSQPAHVMPQWITKAARILRKQDLEGSSASIIEAVRLADSLAGMRGRPRPGLDESLDAIQTVFCQGDPTRLKLLQKPLLVGQKLGSLPDGISQIPLQKDIEDLQRKLRIKRTAGSKDVTLDLREENGQNKSSFLHRILALKIDWGKKTATRTKGTFKEVWQLQWRPELILKIIDASRFGNTLESAAGNCLLETAEDDSVSDLAERLDFALMGKLDQAAERLITRIDQAAATVHDTKELLSAIPALVRIARYGDVRKTNKDAVLVILRHLTARIHIELPVAVCDIDDDNAHHIGGFLRSYTSSVMTLEENGIISAMHATLLGVAHSTSAHPEIKGIATRNLHDSGQLENEATATLFSFALSRGGGPTAAAAWLDGFLSGSGSVLIHDTELLSLMDHWMSKLDADAFQESIPVLRRTFGSFEPPIRNRIASVIAQMDATRINNRTQGSTQLELNVERALPAVTHLAQLLDLHIPAEK